MSIRFELGIKERESGQTESSGEWVVISFLFVLSGVFWSCRLRLDSTERTSRKCGEKKMEQREGS